jgi:hypothetical protein
VLDRARLVLSLLLLAGAAACNLNLNKNTNGPSPVEASPTPKPDASPTPKPSPGASPAASCPAVVRVTLGSMGGVAPGGVAIPGGQRDVPAGSVLNLDITPRGADGNPVPSTCHDLAPSVLVQGTCALVPAGNPFTPSLRVDRGSCVVTATSNGFSDSKDFVGR